MICMPAPSPSHAGRSMLRMPLPVPKWRQNQWHRGRPRSSSVRGYMPWLRAQFRRPTRQPSPACGAIPLPVPEQCGVRPTSKVRGANLRHRSTTRTFWYPHIGGTVDVKLVCERPGVLGERGEASEEISGALRYITNCPPVGIKALPAVL